MLRRVAAENPGLCPGKGIQLRYRAPQNIQRNVSGTETWLPKSVLWQAEGKNTQTQRTGFGCVWCTLCYGLHLRGQAIEELLNSAHLGNVPKPSTHPKAPILSKKQTQTLPATLPTSSPNLTKKTLKTPLRFFWYNGGFFWSGNGSGGLGGTQRSVAPLFHQLRPTAVGPPTNAHQQPLNHRAAACSWTWTLDPKGLLLVRLTLLPSPHQPRPCVSPLHIPHQGPHPSQPPPPPLCDIPSG